MKLTCYLSTIFLLLAQKTHATQVTAGITDQQRDYASVVRLILAAHELTRPQKLELARMAWGGDLGLRAFLQLVSESYTQKMTAPLSIFSTTDSGIPMLHLLAHTKPVTTGIVEALSFAFAQGADANVLNARGHSALMALVRQPITMHDYVHTSLPIIRCLLEHGAHLQVGEHNSFCDAIAWSNAPVLKALCEYAGAQISQSMITQGLTMSAQVVVQSVQAQAHVGSLIQKQQKDIRALLSRELSARQAPLPVPRCRYFGQEMATFQGL